MTKRFTLKNPQQEIQLFNGRMIILAMGIAALVCVVIIRLWYLQIYQHQLYTTLSEKNQLNLLPIEPNRGLIYDRHGILLAENTPIFSLEIIPNKVEKLEDTIKALTEILSITEDEKRRFYKQRKQHRRFESVPLRTRLTEAEVARFLVDQYRFPGVLIKAQMVRNYPLGASLVPVLGYVGRINENELREVDSNNYSATNYIGKLGIEKYFEDILHGTVGYQQVETDATGRVVRVLKSVAPIPGNNLYLTIDSRLQQIALAALGDEAGAVVAIQPRTGQILALVSNPSYDPNLFADGISHQELKALQEHPRRPLYNRAVRGQYAPGSTIKPVIALQGLATETVEATDSLFDPGWYQLKNSSHIYHDWKRSGHGWVNLTSAIIQSCDTYFYNLAFHLGIKQIAAILHQFGFGQITGVEMKEELAGLLPNPEWKKRVHHQSWYPGDTLITGIGQGFLLATPLQQAKLVSTLAMKGKGMQPTLLLGTQTVAKGYIQHLPKPLSPIIMPASAWQTVIDAMQGVMTMGTGLARFGRGTSYEVAGKSGTVQVFSLKQNERYDRNRLPRHLHDHSQFIAFAPIEQPEIAVAVLVEHSDKAGSIARLVMDGYFDNLPNLIDFSLPGWYQPQSLTPTKDFSAYLFH